MYKSWRFRRWMLYRNNLGVSGQGFRDITRHLTDGTKTIPKKEKWGLLLTSVTVSWKCDFSGTIARRSFLVGELKEWEVLYG